MPAGAASARPADYLRSGSAARDLMFILGGPGVGALLQPADHIGAAVAHASGAQADEFRPVALTAADFIK